MFKEREPAMQALRRRVLAKRATSGASATAVPVGAGAGAATAVADADGSQAGQDDDEGQLAGDVEPPGQVDELGRTAAADPQTAVEAR